MPPTLAAPDRTQADMVLQGWRGAWNGQSQVGDG